MHSCASCAIPNYTTAIRDLPITNGRCGVPALPPPKPLRQCDPQLNLTDPVLARYASLCYRGAEREEDVVCADGFDYGELRV